MEVGPGAGPLGRLGDGGGHGEDGSLLARLRSPLGRRPAVDPGLAGGLRAWLEDAAASPDRPAGAVTIRLDGRGGLTSAPAAASFPAAPSPARGTPGAPTISPVPPAHRGDLDAGRVHAAIVGALFRIVVTTEPPRLAFDDAMTALAADDRGAAVAEAVRRLPGTARASLRDAVRLEAATIASQWRVPPSGWLPRTAEHIAVPLSGGRAVLRGTADLMMGAPSDGRASVCALRLQIGPSADDGARGRRFLALLETLRSGAAPFRVASYEPAHGRLTADDVTDELLRAAVADVLEVLGKRTGAARGSR
jgi:hypothetical protein